MSKRIFSIIAAAIVCFASAFGAVTPVNNGVFSGNATGDLRLGNSTTQGNLSVANGTVNFTGATVTLPVSGVSAGTYGSATAVPQMTVNAQGLITGVANVSVSGGVPAGLITTSGLTEGNNTILGRSAGGTGNVQAIVLGANLTFNGSGGLDAILTAANGGNLVTSGGFLTLTSFSANASWTLTGTALTFASTADIAANLVGYQKSANNTAANITDATTVGRSFLTLTNPSAITYARINADNTVTALSGANFIANLSANLATISTSAQVLGLANGTTTLGTMATQNASAVNISGGNLTNIFMGVANFTGNVFSAGTLASTDNSGNLAPTSWVRGYTAPITSNGGAYIFGGSGNVPITISTSPSVVANLSVNGSFAVANPYGANLFQNTFVAANTGNTVGVRGNVFWMQAPSSAYTNAAIAILDAQENEVGAIGLSGNTGYQYYNDVGFGGNRPEMFWDFTSRLPNRNQSGFGSPIGNITLGGIHVNGGLSGCTTAQSYWAFFIGLNGTLSFNAPDGLISEDFTNPSGNLALTGPNNTHTELVVSVQKSNTDSYAQLTACNFENKRTFLVSYSSAFTTVGGLQPNTGAVVTDNTAGLAIMAYAAGGNIYFISGGLSSYRGAIKASTGEWVIGGNVTSATTGSNLTVLGTETVGNMSIGGNINGMVVSTPTSTYAAGTAYSLTTTPAALDFGTTDPVFTAPATGNYILRARVNLLYNAATFAAPRTITLKLRRTNNTAADVSNSSTALTTLLSVGALTYTFSAGDLPEVRYTATSGDTVTIFGSIDVAPGAGSVDAVEASLFAEPCF